MCFSQALLFWNRLPHAYLPGRVRVLRETVERPRVVELEQIADEQEREEKLEPAPHPRVEALDRDVHVVPLAERLQPVQHALLVAELHVLHQADVDVEVHELRAEQLPRFALRPHEQHPGTDGRDEVVQPPPALYPRTVHLFF